MRTRFSRLTTPQRKGVGSKQVEFAAAGYVIDVQVIEILQRWALRIQGLELLT
jgi:hypothetical protein